MSQKVLLVVLQADDYATMRSIQAGQSSERTRSNERNTRAIARRGEGANVRTTSIIIGWVLLGFTCFGADTELQTTYESPDKRFSVEITANRLSGSNDDWNDKTILIKDNGKEIAKFPSYGYLLSVLWSGTGEYVAVNNRRANAGDYIWVISLPDGKCIKQPDDATGTFFGSAAERAFRAIDARVSDRTLIRETFTAKEWKNGNDLVIHAFGEYQFVQGKAYTPFTYFGTFHVIGSTFGFVTGEASKLK